MSAYVGSIDLVVLSGDVAGASVSIASALQSDPGVVRTAIVVGGASPTGLSVPIVGLSPDADCRAVIAAPYVAFLRGGDRFLASKLARQLDALREAEGARMAHTGVRRITSNGTVVDDLPARSEAALELFRSVPTSVVVVEADVIGTIDLPPLLVDGATSASWCDVAKQHGAVAIDAVLAEIVVDERDAFETVEQINRQAAIVASATRRADVYLAWHRRELLSRRYLEVERAAWRLEEVSPPLGGPSLEDEIEDLRWALQRQAERFAAACVPWPEHIPDDAWVDDWAETTVMEHQATIEGLHEELRWLHAEVARRERLAETLRADGGVEDGPTAIEVDVPGTRALKFAARRLLHTRLRGWIRARRQAGDDAPGDAKP